MMSDLRESGCLTADTRILRADTGAEVDASGELLASGARDVPVWSLDDRCGYVPRHHDARLLHRASRRSSGCASRRAARSGDGEPPVPHLRRLAAARRAGVGDRLAVAASRPGARSDSSRWTTSEVVLLGAPASATARSCKRQPIRYASIDEANLRAVDAAATALRRSPPCATTTPAARVHDAAPSGAVPADPRQAKPDRRLARRLGLFGLRSHEKFVPAPVFCLPKKQVALFLRHLWATDGSRHGGDDRAQVGRIYYASTSRRLVDDVARLLLRFGISARIQRVAARPATATAGTLDIGGVDDQRAVPRGDRRARARAAMPRERLLRASA